MTFSPFNVPTVLDPRKQEKANGFRIWRRASCGSVNTCDDDKRNGLGSPCQGREKKHHKSGSFWASFAILFLIQLDWWLYFNVCDCMCLCFFHHFGETIHCDAVDAAWKCMKTWIELRISHVWTTSYPFFQMFLAVFFPPDSSLGLTSKEHWLSLAFAEVEILKNYEYEESNSGMFSQFFAFKDLM